MCNRLVWMFVSLSVVCLCVLGLSGCLLVCQCLIGLAGCLICVFVNLSELCLYVIGVSDNFRIKLTLFDRKSVI